MYWHFHFLRPVQVTRQSSKKSDSWVEILIDIKSCHVMHDQCTKIWRLEWFTQIHVESTKVVTYAKKAFCLYASTFVNYWIFFFVNIIFSFERNVYFYWVCQVTNNHWCKFNGCLPSSFYMWYLKS